MSGQDTDSDDGRQSDCNCYGMRKHEADLAICFYLGTSVSLGDVP